MTAQPRVPYWHLYTDADGITRQRRCALTDLRRQAIHGTPG
jgi:hypothetical protein